MDSSREPHLIKCIGWLRAAVLGANDGIISTLSIMTVVFLAILGAAASKVAGVSMMIGIVRVTLWGSVAMVISAGIGYILGVTL
ncbi:MAG: hypothetical protein H0U71_03335 [Gammaproteobacteria bacterium]|nr:hypothetical protein [Gammaproteobacteria bacterium]